MTITVYCPECEAACSEVDPTCPLCGHELQVLARKVYAQPPAEPAPKAQPATTRTVKHFHSKIVGVTHKNADGSSRQAIIGKCTPLEKLTLENDEHNPHDPNAVMVLRSNGKQLGFMNTTLASEIVSKSQRGYRYAVFVKNITGGTLGKESLGVNILIVVADPGVSEQEAEDYTRQIDLSDADGWKGKFSTSGKRWTFVSLIGAIGVAAGIAAACGGHTVAGFFVVAIGAALYFAGDIRGK